MKNAGAFVHVTLDGYFAGPNGEIDWFKAIQKDDEYERFTREQSRGGSTLLFGRTTYEMMQSYWPTDDAAKNDPHMAKVMRESPKVVFSRTLTHVEERPNWKSVELVHEIDPDAIRERKEQSDLTILGSGTIVQRFANLGLLDAIQLVVVPLILGVGKRLFEGVTKKELRLEASRSFKNGIVVMTYRA